MKTFKVIDTWIQSIVVILSILIVVLPNSIEMKFFYSPLDTPLYNYFFVGFFQFNSILIHHIAGKNQSAVRKIYQYTTYVVVGMMLLGFVVEGFLLIFWLMLYAAPFMALFYVGLCFYELRMVKKMLKEQL